jgi:hypothetical protein
MFVTEERNLIYKIESSRRLARVEQDYPVQQALLALPRKSIFRVIIARLSRIRKWG